MLVDESLLSRLDSVVYDPKWAPRRGWHDDHRGHDGTPEYLPAVMQVRDEFLALVNVLFAQGTSCLQLGLGPCNASHELWRVLFPHVVSIDLDRCLLNDRIRFPGMDTRSGFSFNIAMYDLLFVDAGHSYENVRRDYELYAPNVRRGGIIAFHDALPREAYPEVEVHRFLEELDGVHLIGSEVGVAWLVKE